MVKPVTKAEISSFVKGIVTEYSPLNSPADASRDEENFELNRDGTRDRRLGLDVEFDYVIRDSGLTPNNMVNAAISSFKWFNAGNITLNEFAVVQFGNKIHVFDTAKSSISQDGFIGSLTLSGVALNSKISYAAIDGYLVLATGNDVIYIVSYVLGVLSYSTDRLLVRDLWGLPGNDKNDINLRPTVRTDSHIYNLFNQGWGVPRKNSAGTLIDPVGLFHTTYTKYPSNIEVVYTGLQFSPVTSGTPFERIYPNLYDDQLGLDAQAARGYFIIDALKRGTSRQTEFDNNKTKFPALTQTVTVLPTDTTTGGCSLVTDFAGRIFFSGFQGEVTNGDSNSPILSSYVLFSQVVKNSNSIIKCYQEGDPTSRETSTLVDTDGGFIRISGAKQIYGLVALSTSLFVLADNGVWALQGGSDYGFSATNYSVNKISSFGCFNNHSIVTVNDQVYFWGPEGIFVLAKNQYGDWNVTNISEKTIQTLYDNIEDLDKRNSIGVYDQFDKKIRWMYNQDSDRPNRNEVLELVVDVGLGSFSKNRFYTLSNNTPDIVGYVQTASFLSGDEVSNIVVSDVNAVVNGIGVTLSSSTRTSGIQSVKYITLIGTVGANIGFTFAQYKDTSFRDWKTLDGVGVDAKAYILTGQTTAGDSAIAKQTPYLVVHMKRTEDGVELSGTDLIPSRQSSCFIRSQWDWANTINSKKWSSPFQVYRYKRPLFIIDINDPYDNGFETVITKNKLRGRGKALSLYFETESGKDCRILGWNLSLTGNNLA